MLYPTSQPTSPGLWRCRTCGSILGAYTRTGHLWLAADVVDLAQRYTNVVRVRCACGAVNRYYFTRSPLDEAKQM